MLFWTWGAFRGLKFDQSAQFWCSLGPGGGIWVWPCVSQCFLINLGSLRWSDLSFSKKVIFRPPYHSKLAIFRRGQRRVSDTNFFGLSIQFPHQLGPNDGKSSGPGRYLTSNTFWATLTGCTNYTVKNTYKSTATPYYCPQFPVIVHSSISGIISTLIFSTLI